jgi:hypothetical protein
MGTNNSKENSNLTLSDVDNNITRQISLNNKSSIINYYGWQEICRCSHIDWLHGISGKTFSYETNQILFYF